MIGKCTANTFQYGNEDGKDAIENQPEMKG